MKIKGNIQIGQGAQLNYYVVDTGAADAYVVTLRPAPASYTTGLRIVFQAVNANTGTSTINVNGLGVKTIKKNVSSNLAAGDLASGQIAIIVYDGTNFQLIGSVGAGGTTYSSTNGITLVGTTFELGGTQALTKNTTLDVATFGLTALSAGTNVPFIASNTLTGNTSGLGAALKINTAQTTAVLGPELNTTPDSWTVSGMTSVGSGRYDVAQNATGNISFNFGTITIGDVYVLQYTAQVNISNSTFAGVSGTQQVNATTMRLQFKATSTSGVLTITVTSNSSFNPGYFSGISLKKVLGPAPPAFYHTSPGGNLMEFRSDYSTDNMAIGSQAGRYISNVAATSNLAIGTNTLYLNTVGSSNIAIGTNALTNNTEGNYNVAVGVAALQVNKVSSGNVAIGYGTLQSQTTGSANTAIGYLAQGAITTGSNNVAVGQYALSASLSGTGNIALGAYAMYATNVSGNYNVAIGYAAMGALTSGNYNFCFGPSTANSLSSGSSNLAMGYASMPTISTGSDNIHFGYFSGYGNLGAAYEIDLNAAHSADAGVILIGSFSAKDFETAAAASNSVAIGVEAKVYQSNQVVLGGNDISSTFLKGIVETRDFTVLAANTLQDSTFPGGTTKWAVTGAVTLGTNKATFNLNTSSSGTLTQTAANMSIAGKSDRWYKLVVVFSGATANVSTFQMSNYTVTLSGSTFATVSRPLKNVVNNTVKMYFKSKTSPTDFTLTFGGSLVSGSNGLLDVTSISLTEVVGGDLWANRYLRTYAGVVVLENNYTPTSNADTTYPVGSMVSDDTYLYRRKPNGTWQRIAWVAY